MVLHLTSLDGVQLKKTWLTIGSFDGVHIGHQKLINDLNTSAHRSGDQSVVLTFHPHPAVVLRGRTDAFYLTTPSEKAQLLDELGTDILISHPFTHDISQRSARDFITYLLDHLRFSQLWVGHDFALGKGREGNESYLKKLGEELNYKVHIVEPVTYHGGIVSSSRIRQMLTDGDIEKANALLGRPYRVEGVVVHGDGRGKSLGVPTANLDTGSEKLIPAAGVYACRVRLVDKYLPAAVNIGTRPTFESADKLSHVEAYILDYSGDLYNQSITLEFIARLRAEEKYASVEQQLDQVYLDISQTREIISGYS